MTGTPRSRADIKAAFDCLSSEIVRNPLAMSKDGQPLAMHYIVVRDALSELMQRRGEEPL